MQNRIHALLPYGVMGILALTSGVPCLFLPETKGIPTPETVDSEIEVAAEGSEHECVELKEGPLAVKDANNATKI